ncbi:hypothetical protein L1987_36379 [Smallanthus sonchifolius]|uniref:Uncharacterized protein n=1 Tax=Smallanthus sonchifolius TaxID=185202 RepID=A0ACB9HDW5_9ASTR|nr:hypothetical protein L1987_36379 [Smallanthus sonchifolius]
MLLHIRVQSCFASNIQLLTEDQGKRTLEDQSEAVRQALITLEISFLHKGRGTLKRDTDGCVYWLLLSLSPEKWVSVLGFSRVLVTDVSTRRTVTRDMRKLSSSDEPFELSEDELIEIISLVRSRRVPTRESFIRFRWDAYAISFYLKMCTCFGVDSLHLE